MSKQVSFREMRYNEKRDKILKNAARLFARKGYENVSLAEIAAKLMLNKATLYYYFKSKESLAIAVLDLRIEQYVNEIINETLTNNKLTPLKRLEGFYSKVVKFHKKNECKHGCPFGNLANNYRLVRIGLTAIQRAEKLLKIKPEPYQKNKKELKNIQGKVEFIDLPGAYSIYPRSDDEKVVAI